jgi:hypothetical protein
MSAGKGSKPRNCFSKRFKDNYDNIIWSARDGKEVKNYSIKKGKKIYKYP